MRIISTPTRIIECPDCYSKLEIDNSDLIEYSGLCNLAYGNYFVKCPICNEKIYINNRIKKNEKENEE